MALENLDNIEWGELIKPETITEIIRESGCAFLLDISHAYCAARWLGMDFHEYLKKLPLCSVYEIHINGWAQNEKGLMCHVKINDEGYAVLKELLRCCEPEIITVEYGRHNDRIGAGVPVITPEGINERAKEEIVEQIENIRELTEQAQKS